MSERKGTVRAPEFPRGLEWLNVERPLTLRGLRGKLVVLDFWTYCCINCQHVLPQLRKLEQRFPDELVVIGVHSAKFKAEGETFNLRQAVMRHDIRHPVVNDRDFLLWRAYAVRAWPTLVLVDPEGMVIGMTSGEFDGDRFGEGLERIAQAYRATGKLSSAWLEISLEKSKQPETMLSFPGKVLADPAGDRLFVADTDHHRVVEFGLRDGRLRCVYGSGEPGLRDGMAERARLHSPQGMTLAGETLYVADTENHAVRRIALETRGVTLFAGNGRQAARLPQEGLARETALNSPWDLATDGAGLFVAMAGSHQIWRIDLRSGRAGPLAGDGREALRDGTDEARLAQPSGLALSEHLLWFVDSETSSLRSVSLDGRAEVRTAVGLGLFDFGDVDGDRETARLQHPLGVTVSDRLVYVADSYNHRIKVYDPLTGLIRRVSGSGEPGIQDDDSPEEVCFWEPGGLSAAGDALFVADTNNHAVRRVDRRSGAAHTVALRD